MLPIRPLVFNFEKFVKYVEVQYCCQPKTTIVRMKQNGPYFSMCIVVSPKVKFWDVKCHEMLVVCFFYTNVPYNFVCEITLLIGEFMVEFGVNLEYITSPWTFEIENGVTLNWTYLHMISFSCSIWNQGNNFVFKNLQNPLS